MFLITQVDTLAPIGHRNIEVSLKVTTMASPPLALCVINS